MDSAPSAPNYWSLLRLSPGSNSDQLKRAFLREAKRWHPDLNSNDRNAEERFKLINEAYAILSDPRKRLEWELAGQPTYEIRDFEINKDKVSSPNKNQPANKATGFNQTEKLILISISSLLLLRAFNF